VAADGPFKETLMRRLGPLPTLLAASAVALAAVTAAALAPGSPLAASCAAAGSNHAAVIVEHGDGSVVTRCVAFDAASVTGEQLLASSGVVWSGQTFGGYGVAVCALDAEPAHYATCPGADSYWAVFVSRDGGAWQLANVGISTLTLGDGDAEGFRYVPAAGDPSPPSAVGLCPGQAAAAAASVNALPSVHSDPPSSGLDLGLLAAAAVAVGLAGLALARLVLSRRGVR
jgi:hypothetical protein